MGKLFRVKQYVAILTFSLAIFSCTKDSTNNPTPPGPTPPSPTHEDEAINKKMDAVLRERYYWNEEYLTLKPNYAQAYNEFLPSLLLNQMKTNIFDRKKYATDPKTGQDLYRIYSNVQRLPQTSATQSTRGVNHGSIVKEAKINFGIVSMVIAKLDETATLTTYAFVVSGVYPASPAADAGITRGVIISKVNGLDITNDNYESLYYSITRPAVVGDITLTKLDVKDPIKLTSKSMYPNPVLMTKVFVAGDKRTGYIVYQGFDAAYDDELLAAIKLLKDDRANEIILDLRLNGGGHVITSNMLSTCIAGSKCENKVYQYYKYNPARMANPEKTASETGNAYDSNKKYFYEDFYYGDYFDVDLRDYALNMPRVFALVSSDTASASEAVINGLRGIDIPVTMIGATTSGKNVGMETIKLKDDRYNYAFAPITFEGFNAQEKSVNYLGMTPEYPVDEWMNGLRNFGDHKEPLLAQALSLITGVAPATMDTRSDLGLRLVSGALLTTDFSRQGMIQLPPMEH